MEKHPILTGFPTFGSFPHMHVSSKTIVELDLLIIFPLDFTVVWYKIYSDTTYATSGVKKVRSRIVINFGYIQGSSAFYCNNKTN